MSKHALHRWTIGLALTLACGAFVGCASDGGPGGVTPPPTPPPPPQPPVRPVNIHVMSTGHPAAQWIRVDRVGIGLCKYSVRCPSDLEFRLIHSPHIGASDEIHITTVGGDTSCLNPPPPYTLTLASSAQQVSIGASCPDSAKYVWTYNVECVDSGGGDCGIAPADPGVIIDGGGPP